MTEKFIASSVISCGGRFETYKKGSLKNPKITLGDIVKPVGTIIQQFSDKSTEVVCPYFEEKEGFCTALDSASDSEECRQAIKDRASFIINSGLGTLEKEEERWNKRVSMNAEEEFVISGTKCPYKKDKPL